MKKLIPFLIFVGIMVNPAASQFSNPQEDWNCYTENAKTSPSTCTSNPEEIDLDQAKVKVQSTEGLCGYGGIARTYENADQTISLNVGANFRIPSDLTKNFGQAGIYLEKGGKIYTVKEWEGGGTQTAKTIDWTNVEFNPSNYGSGSFLGLSGLFGGNKATVIIGNNDSGEYCNYEDHDFTIWATDEEIQNGRSINLERSSENPNNQESETEKQPEETEEQPDETQETSAENNEEETNSVCNGEFDAWIVETEKADYPVEIRGCLTDDLEQINTMIRYDDGTNSYLTSSIQRSSDITCHSGTCETTTLSYEEQLNKDYDFKLEITDGKSPSGLDRPVEVDVDLLALNETYAGGRAGQTEVSWLEEACGSDTYSCVSSSQKYKANLVSKVGLISDYEPAENITIQNGVTVQLPEGCDYRATYAYGNRPKLKIWYTPDSTAEVPLRSRERIETSRGTTFNLGSMSEEELTFSATCSEWETSSNETTEGNQTENNQTESIETDITWINYCRDRVSDSLTDSDNVVECISKCYGEDKDSDAEGSDLSCGEVVKSFCGSVEPEYNEDSDKARCGQ